MKKGSGTVEIKNMATAKPKRRQSAKTRVAPALPSSKLRSVSPQVRLAAAHAKFTQTQKGTRAHDKAWEELVDALFVKAK
jgi:hypothetical protein